MSVHEPATTITNSLDAVEMEAERRRKLTETYTKALATTSSLDRQEISDFMSDFNQTFAEYEAKFKRQLQMHPASLAKQYEYLVQEQDRVPKKSFMQRYFYRCCDLERIQRELSRQERLQLSNESAQYTTNQSTFQNHDTLEVTNSVEGELRTRRSSLRKARSSDPTASNMPWYNRRIRGSTGPVDSTTGSASKQPRRAPSKSKSTGLVRFRDAYEENPTKRSAWDTQENEKAAIVPPTPFERQPTDEDSVYQALETSRRLYEEQKRNQAAPPSKPTQHGQRRAPLKGVLRNNKGVSRTYSLPTAFWSACDVHTKARWADHGNKRASDTTPLPMPQRQATKVVPGGIASPLPSADAKKNIKTSNNHSGKQSETPAPNPPLLTKPRRSLSLLEDDEDEEYDVQTKIVTESLGRSSFADTLKQFGSPQGQRGGSLPTTTLPPSLPLRFSADSSILSPVVEKPARTKSAPFFKVDTEGLIPLSAFESPVTPTLSNVRRRWPHESNQDQALRTKRRADSKNANALPVVPVRRQSMDSDSGQHMPVSTGSPRQSWSMDGSARPPVTPSSDVSPIQDTREQGNDRVSPHFDRLPFSSPSSGAYQGTMHPPGGLSKSSPHNAASHVPYGSVRGRRKQWTSGASPPDDIASPGSRVRRTMSNHERSVSGDQDNRTSEVDGADRSRSSRSTSGAGRDLASLNIATSNPLQPIRSRSPASSPQTDRSYKLSSPRIRQVGKGVDSHAPAEGRNTEPQSPSVGHTPRTMRLFDSSTKGSPENGVVVKPLATRSVTLAKKRRSSPNTYTTPLNAQSLEQGENYVEFEHYVGEFGLEKYDDDIQIALAMHSDTVARHFHTLVPSAVTTEQFWQRYFWRCDEKRVLRQLRRKEELGNPGQLAVLSLDSKLTQSTGGEGMEGNASPQERASHEVESPTREGSVRSRTKDWKVVAGGDQGKSLSIGASPAVTRKDFKTDMELEMQDSIKSFTIADALASIENEGEVSATTTSEPEETSPYLVGVVSSVNPQLGDEPNTYRNPDDESGTMTTSDASRYSYAKRIEDETPLPIASPTSRVSNRTAKVAPDEVRGGC